MINTDEKAHLTMTVARALVNIHDQILAEYANSRSKFELACLHPNREFNKSEQSVRLEQLLKDAQGYADRVISHLPDIGTFEEFRRKVEEAVTAAEVLAQYENRILTRTIFMNAYDETGTHPIDDEKLYVKEDAQKEMGVLRTQLGAVRRNFYKLCSAIDVGETSNLIEVPALDLEIVR